MLKPSLKILIVGSWVTSVYEEPLYKAFKSLSQDVYSFKWGSYFSFFPLSNSFDDKSSFLKSLYSRFQNKYILGPSIYRINKDLLKKINELNPDIIFFYRPTHIWPSTFSKIKKISNTVFIYNNDDPFSKKLPKYIYRHFLKSIFFADWIFSYREKNLHDYYQLKLSNVSILKSCYIDTQNFCLNGINKEYDVVFIGHYEDDGRDEKIISLMKDKKIKVGLWGTGWKKSRHYHLLTNHLGEEVHPIFGDQYNLTINKSKIALVFFSKINNDEYTRRCFEIPATKTLMLCEYSPTISKMFDEEIEADFFRNTDELVLKVRKYLSNDTLRLKVAQQGHERVIKDQHEVKDRAKQIIDIYQDLVSDT